ncbi:MAG: MEDS domain-containing protein [Candidatus Bathyarchaeia archaeon]
MFLVLAPNIRRYTASHLTVNPSVLDYVAHLPPTAHAVFCYENVETVRQVLVSYLKGSQERNEAVYILSSSRESFDDFLHSSKLYAPFAEQQIDCIEMSKFSSRTKGIDYETAMNLIKSRLDATKRLGFNGLRIFVLANDYLDYATAEGVLEFEKQLGQNFPIPITAICAYDLAEAGGRWDQVLLDLLKAHGAHVFKGLAGSDRDGAH